MREIASSRKPLLLLLFAFCTYAAVAAAAAMMFQIGGREEATDLEWRLPRCRLGSRLPWSESEGVCLLANFVIGHGIVGKDIPIMARLAKARRWSK
jgi:hypothetical protein